MGKTKAGQAKNRRKAYTATSAPVRTKLSTSAKLIGHAIYGGRNTAKQFKEKTGIIREYPNTIRNVINHWTPPVITTMQGKNKNQLAYNLKIREALEIRKNESGPGKGLNEDMGAYVKTDIWDPVLRTMD